MNRRDFHHGPIHEPRPFDPSVHKFWMVYCIWGGHPSVIHETYTSALDECERLAKANPNKKFVVLESKTLVQVDSPPVIKKNY